MQNPLRFTKEVICNKNIKKKNNVRLISPKITYVNWNEVQILLKFHMKTAFFKQTHNLNVNLLNRPRKINSNFHFRWTYGIFKRGYTKLFGIEDLCAPLKNDRSQKVGDNLQM